MAETDSPQDIIPPLGISRAALDRAIYRNIEYLNTRLENGLKINTKYAVPNDPSLAAEINDRFYRRVETVTNFFRSPTMFPSIRVNVIFSQEPIIETYDWKPYGGPNINKFAARVIEVGDNTGWDNDIEVDFRRPFTTEVDSIVAWSRMIRRLAKNDTRSILFIIDGYGKPALESNFLMTQDLAQSSGLDSKITTIMRYAKGQEKLDSSYGSPWTSAPWQDVYFDKGGKVVDETEIGIPNHVEYDPKRSAPFIAALAEGLTCLRQGENVAVRAPFRMGKSTVLEALAHLKPADISVGYMIEGGKLFLINENLEPNMNNIKPTIIVDEAGRLGAEATLQTIESTGRKVLRVYPGDVKAIDGYRVIDVHT